MEVVKKLTEKELAQIKAIQEKTHSAVMELGQIELTKIQLGERRAAVDAFLETVVEEEKALAKELETAYGKGSINLQTGEMTITEEVVE
jgi:hypothetical protein